jgi:hypothetical protein
MMTLRNLIFKSAFALSAVCVSAVWASAGAGANPPSASEPDVARYLVKPGDNLYLLASRYFNRVADYRAVQRLNQVADPLKLPVGKTLQIPLGVLKSTPLDARMVAYRGTVSVEQHGKATPLSVNMLILEGSVIQTGNDGFMTLLLSSGSRVTLPSGSRVRLKAIRKYLLTGATDVDIAVEAGRAETSVSPLRDANSRFRTRTPVSVSAVRGTSFRTAFSEGTGSGQSEVIEGKVAVAGASEELIPAGFGAVVDRSGAVSKDSLLPAPAVLAPGKTQHEALVVINIDPIAGAKTYRTQIASDAGFVDTVAETVTSTPNAEFARVPDGNYFVRANAIASSGLEGLSQAYNLKRRLGTVGGALEKGDDGKLAFKWFGQGDGARIYRFQLANDAEFSSMIVDETALTGQGLSLAGLPPQTYFWRVGVAQFTKGEVDENWTSPEKLIISAPEK